MNTTTNTVSDYLSEVMRKLSNGGLRKSELAGEYKDKAVALGVSVNDFVKLMKLDGALREKEDRFELCPN